MDYELIATHRAIGRLIERTERHVIIETSPRPGGLIVQPVHMTWPPSAADVALSVRFDLAEIIERARFLGVSTADVRAMFEQELATIAD